MRRHVLCSAMMTAMILSAAAVAEARETLALLSKTWGDLESEVVGIDPQEQKPDDDDAAIILLGVKSPKAIFGARGLPPADPRRAAYDRAEAEREKLSAPYEAALTTQSALADKVYSLKTTVERGNESMLYLQKQLDSLRSESNPSGATRKRIGELQQTLEKTRADVDRAQAQLGPAQQQLAAAQGEAAKIKAQRDGLASVMSSEDKKIYDQQKKP